MAERTREHSERGRWVFSCIWDPIAAVSRCWYTYYDKYKLRNKFRIHCGVSDTQLLPEEVLQLVACEAE